MCRRHYQIWHRQQNGILPRRIITKQEPRECEGCGRSIRPRRGTAEEYPGTVTYGSANQCTTCYKKGVWASREEIRHLASIKQSLDSWNREREERIRRRARRYGLAA